MTDKIEILQELKSAWDTLKNTQRNINALERRLIKLDPTRSDITIFDNTVREQNLPDREYTISEQRKHEVRTFADNFFQTKHYMTEYTKEHYPEFATAVSIGQAVNIFYQK